MKNLKPYIRFYPLLVGGIIGYAYYYFIGCTSGKCAIQSNPYFSTIYGVIAGAIFLMPGKKKEIDDEKENS